MASETEAKFYLSQETHERLLRSIKGGVPWAGFRVVVVNSRTHTDTYFDGQGVLGDSGCSLRLRTADDAFQVTYKEPRVLVGNVLTRREIQNTDMNDLEQTVRQISKRLTRLGFTSAKLLRTGDLMQRGIRGWLRDLDLEAAFTITTHRVACVAYSGEALVAEVALDESDYSVGVGHKVIHQLEIERRGDDPKSFSNLIATCEQEKGLTPTPATKYQIGVDLWRASPVREKVEQKVLFEDRMAFEQAIDICSNITTLDRYAIRLLAPSDSISDSYFDSTTFRLAESRSYLRRRNQDGDSQWTFRRIDPPRESDPEAFASQMQLRSGWTRAPADIVPADLVAALDEVGAVRSPPADLEIGQLRDLGMTEVLNVEIHRRVAIVDLVSGSAGIAKVKFDEIGVRSPGNNRVRHLYEAEVTGLGGPGSPPNASYRVYRDLTLLMAGLLGGEMADGTQVSKYARGLDVLKLRALPANSARETFRPLGRQPKLVSTQAAQSYASALVGLMASFFVGLLLASVDPTWRPGHLTDLQLEIGRWVVVAGLYTAGGLYFRSRARSLLDPTAGITLVACGAALLFVALVGVGMFSDIVGVVTFPAVVLTVLRRSSSGAG